MGRNWKELCPLRFWSFINNLPVRKRPQNLVTFSQVDVRKIWCARSAIYGIRFFRKWNIPNAFFFLSMTQALTRKLNTTEFSQQESKLPGLLVQMHYHWATGNCKRVQKYSYFCWTNITFVAIKVVFVSHFVVLLLILITFRSSFPKLWGKPESESKEFKMADVWGNYHVIWRHPQKSPLPHQQKTKRNNKTKIKKATTKTV